MQLIIMKQDNGVHSKGDIVEIRASGTPFVGKEPDAFVMVDVPGVPMLDYEKYNLMYNVEIDFEVLSSDLDTDTHRLRIFSTLTPDFLSYITPAKVQGFVSRWNGVYISHSSSELIFDMSIYDALQSKAFWGLDVGNCIFEELSYSNGVHRIQIDYTDLDNNPTWMERIVSRKGLDVVSNKDKVIVLDAERGDVRTIFQDDIKEKSTQMISRRRYNFTNNVVNAIISNGGTITATESEVLLYIKDKSNG